MLAQPAGEWAGRQPSPSPVGSSGPKLIPKSYLTVPVQLCYGASRAYHFESTSTNPPYRGSLVVPHRLAVDAGRQCTSGQNQLAPYLRRAQ